MNIEINAVVKEFKGRRQLAEALGVSRQAVEKWAKSGEIPAPRQFQIAHLTSYKFAPVAANPWD